MSEDNALGYLERQISTLEDVAVRETRYSNTKTEYAYRPIYFRLKGRVKQFLDDEYSNNIVMPGLRGVGKTVLLFQIYNEFKENFDEAQLLYLTCDTLTGPVNSSLEETLDVYEKRVLGKRIENLDSKILLLIDEAHYQDDWDSIAKSFADRNQDKVMFIITGSSSLALEMSTDMTRRSDTERTYPLRFYEYELLKSRNTAGDLIYPPTDTASNLFGACFKELGEPEARDKLLNNISSNLRTGYFPKIDNDIEIEIEKFLTEGGFPFCLGSDRDRIFEKTIDVSRRVTDQDIVEMSDLSISSIKRGMAILQYLADAEETSGNNIASRIGNVSGTTVSNILEAYDNAGMLHTVNAAGSTRQVQSKPSKYFFTSPTLQASFLWLTGNFNMKSETLGSLLETAVADVIMRRKHTNSAIVNEVFYDYEDGGADFVVKTSDERTVIVEVGWGDKKNKGPKQVANSLENVNGDYGIVVSDTTSDFVNVEVNGDEKPVFFIPKEIFLVQ